MLKSLGARTGGVKAGGRAHGAPVCPRPIELICSGAPSAASSLQAGAIDVYDRRNMLYYDLFTGRRADQLPRAPYASLTFCSK